MNANQATDTKTTAAKTIGAKTLAAGFTGARHAPLVSIAVALAAGIVCDRYLPAPPAVWWSLAVVFLLLWLVNFRRQQPRVAALFLLLAMGCCGGGWHHVQWRMFAADDIGCFATVDPSPVCLEATLLTAPEQSYAPPPDPMEVMPRGDRSYVVLQIQSIRQQAATGRGGDAVVWRSASGRCEMLVEGHLPGLAPGDRVRVFGKLARAAPPQNPGGFDYGRFQRRDRQLCHLKAQYPDCVVLTQRGSSWNWRRWTAALRNMGETALYANMPRQQASLATALLLGKRKQLSRGRTDRFFVTGSIHLLAISGLHVGILAYFFFAIGSISGRRNTLLATIVFVVLYAIVTGGRTPVVRAAVLVSTFCLASYSGRKALSFNTLAAAAVVVLGLSPAQLFEAGTQLSFLAVATLVYCAPWLAPQTVEDPLDRLIAATRPWHIKMLRAAASYAWRLWLTGFVVWAVALPLAMYHFNIVSPVAVFLNPLLMLPVAVGLVSGFVVMLTGWLLPPLALLAGMCCGQSLWLLESAVGLAEPVPGGYWYTAGPAWAWVAVFYLGAAWLVAAPRYRPVLRWRVALPVCWAAVAVAGAGFAMPVGGKPALECTVISVGHGSSVLIELPDGRNLLYDAGHLAPPEAGAAAIARVLWSRGIERLDAVVISHADADHYNCLPALLKKVPAGVVYVSPVMFKDEEKSASLASLRQSIIQAGAPIRYLSAEQNLQAGAGAEIETLHPLARGVAGSDNANSIVLRVQYQGRCILLPGDLEPPGLADVLAEATPVCDVAVAPHHGSPRSQPARFVEWCKPQWVIISAGRAEHMDEYKEGYRRTGAKVLHTAESGAVRVTIRNGDVLVRSWLQQ